MSDCKDSDGSTVGFIGLGLLGTPVARRLLQAGHPLVVWNRTGPKMAPLIEEGAQGAASPADVMRRSDIVFVCVHDAEAVEEVVFGANGIADTAGPAALVVDHSSIHPTRTRDFAGRLERQCGASWVDAPVSGGVPAALSGTLTVMAGGSQAAFDRADQFFTAYARRRTLVGPVGAGQTAKLCNQVIIAASLWSVAESTRLAVTGGIDPTRLPEYLEGGLADSPFLRLYQPRMASVADTSLGSSADLLKDLDACMDLARHGDCPLPITALAAELLRTAHKWTPAAAAGRVIDLLTGPQTTATPAD
ncbi:NAD(P)-dependent oxidoreductase [Streptomyces sp. G1]|uniref:NAD(P)-dependent oxidoreductase n=1 Tax=Streptomyces sp. G1 TaxID=361572 RepID=UPI0020300746|nr:NAD(P)-dependent oxidoreductase [Streptomyces sp. G1]MCM1969439.1 NAD(P)-dependent oxidoreductase [Streptomyces sp. G1]